MTLAVKGLMMMMMMMMMTPSSRTPRSQVGDDASLLTDVLGWDTVQPPETPVCMSQLVFIVIVIENR